MKKSQTKNRNIAQKIKILEKFYQTSIYRKKNFFE